MLIACLVALVAALAYIVHERLDLARFNAQANDSAIDGVLGTPADQPKGGA
jgi:phosphatidylserine synthase